MRTRANANNRSNSFRRSRKFAAVIGKTITRAMGTQMSLGLLGEHPGEAARAPHLHISRLSNPFPALGFSPYGKVGDDCGVKRKGVVPVVEGCVLAESCREAGGRSRLFYLKIDAAVHATQQPVCARC